MVTVVDSIRSFEKAGPSFTVNDPDRVESNRCSARFGTAGVHSSGIEANRGEMLEIMSSCFKVVVMHTHALVSARRDEWGLVWKVSIKVDQSMIRLVLQSHGRLSTIGADG